MNLRLFTVLMLASTLPLAASAAARLSLNEADFISAKRITRNGGALVSVKLSKSGKAKLRKLNKEAVGKDVHSEIAGVDTGFTLREPIKGDGLEMGPYSESDAAKVVSAINKK